jgi:imidazolonepropionase-like amidohydrolase
MFASRALAAVALTLAAGPIRAAETVTLIRAGALVDVAAGETRSDQVILVRGRRIEAVGTAASIHAPADATVIDLGRVTVLPGMIDSHTHLFLQGEEAPEDTYDTQLLTRPLAFRVARATVSARRALEQGFTTVRDLETEGAGYGDVGLKEAIDGGYIPGPRIFTTTRGLSTTGGYPLEGYAPEVTVPKGVQVIDGPVEARKAAREQLDHGADWIKVYMTHRSWVGPKGELVSQPTLTVEELRAIVDETHGWGRKVACHAYGGEGLRRALEGGCDSIEHGLDMDEATVERMVKQGTWYCPTLSVYYPRQGAGTARDQVRVKVHGPSFQRAMKAGVRIVFGTDAGGFPWTEPIAQEFGHMVTELGMSPRDALRSATVAPAEMLGMAGQLGVLAPGAYADIIAVEGDPLKDVTSLGRVSFVMKDGVVFKGREPSAPRSR